MKTFEQDFKANPSFNTVLNLSNTTFDPNNVVGGRMATEGQIKQLEDRYSALENRRDYCCRDIVIWKSYTRIINSEGFVVSNFSENLVVGETRRGREYTVTFSPKWNSSIYQPYSGWKNTWKGNFSIIVCSRTNASDSTVNIEQARREEMDYLLNTTNSPRSSEAVSGNNPLSDVTGLNSVSKRITANSNVTLPLTARYANTTEDMGTIYMQNDGTLTIDVFDRRMYRGLENYYPNDPAFLVVFATQFVLI